MSCRPSEIVRPVSSREPANPPNPRLSWRAGSPVLVLVALCLLSTLSPVDVAASSRRPEPSAPASHAGGTTPSVPWDASSRRPFLRPVDAEVVEGFGAHDQPYGPGNRGLDYAVVPGTAVRAIGPGRVVFAGPVAGSLYVTVQHRSGLRSSYSYLRRIDVAVGQTVRVGDRLGATGSEFQLGIRRGSVYIDPAPLLGSRLWQRVRLVVPAGFGRRPPGG